MLIIWAFFGWLVVNLSFWCVWKLCNWVLFGDLIDYRAGACVNRALKFSAEDFGGSNKNSVTKVSVGKGLNRTRETERRILRKICYWICQRISVKSPEKGRPLITLPAIQIPKIPPISCRTTKNIRTIQIDMFQKQFFSFEIFSLHAYR